MTVQAIRFDPPYQDGIPAFHTQRVPAGAYSIVASETVSLFALTLLLNMPPDEADIRSYDRKTANRRQ